MKKNNYFYIFYSMKIFNFSEKTIEILMVFMSKKNSTIQLILEIW
jgi:hypothetical protein